MLLYWSKMHLNFFFRSPMKNINRATKESFFSTKKQSHFSKIPFWSVVIVVPTVNGCPFHWNPELWGLGRQIGQIILGHLGYFRLNYQYPFWYSESLIHVFHYSTIISIKKLSLYIHIPNIYLGLGFEFGLQRIRDLAFMCS